MVTLELMLAGPGDLHAKATVTSMPGKSVWPPPPPEVEPPLVVPPDVVPPEVDPPLVVPPDVPPPPSVTLIVAAALTVSFGVHLVSVDIGLETLMLYASGVSVTSPAVVSLILPFMSDSFIGLFLGIGGFERGPSIAMFTVCAPAAFSVPVGFTVSFSRSRMSGFFEAASTNFHTTSTSSPTFASAGAVICTFVVPCTGGSPEMGGGMHSVLYATSAAWAGLAASRIPAPPSISATPAALILRCVLTNVPSSWTGCLTVRSQV